MAKVVTAIDNSVGYEIFFQRKVFWHNSNYYVFYASRTGGVNHFYYKYASTIAGLNAATPVSLLTSVLQNDATHNGLHYDVYHDAANNRVAIAWGYNNGVASNPALFVFCTFNGDGSLAKSTEHILSDLGGNATTPAYIQINKLANGNWCVVFRTTAGWLIVARSDKSTPTLAGDWATEAEGWGVPLNTWDTNFRIGPATTSKIGLFIINPTDFKIYSSVWDAGFAALQASTALVDNVGVDDQVSNPAVDSVGDTHFVYVEKTTLQIKEIVYDASADSWGTPITIDAAPTVNLENPSIIYVGTYLYCYMTDRSASSSLRLYVKIGDNWREMTTVFTGDLLTAYNRDDTPLTGFSTNAAVISWLDSTNKDIYMNEVVLNCTFTGTPLSGEAPLKVKFTDTSSFAQTRWFWEFGDGRTSTEQHPTHTYRMPGIYTIKLQIWNVYGDTLTLTRTAYIAVTETAVTIDNWPLRKTDKAMRYGFNPAQMRGWAENSGVSYLWPFVNLKAMKTFDKQNQQRQLILDGNSLKLYEPSLREGPAGSAVSKSYKDKVAHDDTGGTNIVARADGPEAVGIREHDELEHVVHHLNFRPQEKANRGAAGYDSEGFPTGLKVDVSQLTDGAQATTTLQAKDIDKDGDVHLDKKFPDVKRAITSIVTNMSQLKLVSWVGEYLSKNKASAPDKRKGKELDWQREYRSPILWLDRGTHPVRDRATTQDLTSDGYTRITGPEGRSNSALQFAGYIQTVDSKVITTGTLIIWYSGNEPNVFVGAVDLGALTAYSDAVGGWILAYKKAITQTGIVKFEADTLCKLFAPRIIPREVSDDAIDYFYRDVRDNEGKVMSPKG